jgi:predicted dehydrogenase
MSALKAAVIGLGNIGMGYDYAHRGDDRILTHAHAFAAHPGFELVGAVDPDDESRRRFTNRYARGAYRSIAELFAQERPEVVALAIPTALHARTFHELIAHKPRIILCEKPLAGSVTEAEEMLAAAERAGIAVMVNYMRLCEPGTLALHQRIAAGDLGEVRKGVVWYSKGLANNGSHFIDLLRMLLGEAGAIAVLDAGRIGNGNDPEPDVRIVFGKTPVYFLAARHEDYGINAFELLGSRAQVRYIDGGLRVELRQVTADGALDAAVSMIDNDMQRYQYHVCESLHRHLAGGEPLATDGANALETLRVVGKITALLSR